MSPILIVNCKIVSPTLNVNPTTLSFFGKSWGMIDLQCYNCWHLPSDFSSKFQAFMTIFHHKLLTIEGRVLVNGWTHPPLIMTIIVQSFLRSVLRKSYHSDFDYHMTLNIMFSVVIGNFPSLASLLVGVVITHFMFLRCCKASCHNMVPTFSFFTITFSLYLHTICSSLERWIWKLVDFMARRTQMKSF